MVQIICISFLNQICLHFLAKYVVQDLNYTIIALLNCIWFSLSKMLLFDVIKKNVTTPCRLVIYETKKCSPSVLLRPVSSPFFVPIIFFLRARISFSVVKSLSKPYENRSSFGAAEFSHRDRNFTFSLLYLCLFLFTVLFPFQQALTAPQISIVWGTTTNASSSDVLKGFDGLPLSAGVQGNGDGDLVELGYFSEASTGSPFSGTWIPLTKQTKVGDSSSGYGFGNGMFIFTSNFYRDSDQVVVFPTEPKEYSEELGFTVTSSTPPTGTPFCIRFYDGPQKGGARYNTVTGDNWLWPAFPNGSSIPSNLYIKIASGSEPAGSSWKYGSTFEDNDQADRFKTPIIPQYTIGVAISGYSNGQGSVTDINGSYGWGDSVNLAATPAPHFGFMGWIGEGIAEPWNQNTTLTVGGDQTVYADFFAIPYLLNLEAQGDGSVSGSGSFVFGEVVTINAYPSFGHSFIRWEKNGNTFSSSAEVTLTMDGDTNLTAVFARNEYTVNVGATEGGTYEILDSNQSAPSSYGHGLGYTLRALPYPHYGFSSWYSTATGLSMIGNESFAQTTFIPTADANFTAIFSELNYNLTIESTQGYNALTESGTFPALSIIPVKVEVSEGFVFDYWLDPMGILADPNSWQTEANISRIYPYMEASISAVLRLDDYDESDINMTSDYGGNISFESDETGGFTHYNTYELNATPVLGYQFDQWEGDTEQLEFSAFDPSNKVLIEGPLSLKATYKLSLFNLTLSVEGDGNTIGPETFTISDTPTIKALAFPGFKFTHWTGDTDFLLDHLASETFIPLESNSIPRDLSFTANFIPETYEVQLSTIGTGSVDIYLSNGDAYDDSVSRELTIDSQTQITLEAMPPDGWDFTIWSGLPDLSELLDPVAYLDPYSTVVYFYPPKDLNISALFEISKYSEQEIVVRAGNGGNVFLESEGNGNFLHFASYDLNASPQRGYEFTQWITDPSKISTLLNGIEDPNNVLTIEGPVELNASFSPIVFNLTLQDSDGGSASGPSTYTVLDAPFIQANAYDGWEFTHWTGNTEYLSNPQTSGATVDHFSLELKNLNFTPNFSRKVYNISLNSQGSGSFEIFKNGTSYNSGTSPQLIAIDSATRISVSAIPSSGWKFSNWYALPDPNELIDPNPSLNTSSSSINFIPAFDANFTAQFVRQNYMLQILQPEFGGSVTTGGLFPFESIVEINASAQEHYNFHQWGGDTEHLIYSFNKASNQIRIPDSNLTIQPIFKPKIYSLNTDPSNAGYFEISGTYNNIIYTSQSEFNATSSITLSALPNNSDEDMLNYLYWENSLGESGYQYSSTLTIPFLDGNYSFRASFVPRNDIGYFLYSSPPYGGAAGVDSAYSTAQFQNLIASPNPGFSFIGWSSESGNSFSPSWAVHSVDSALNDNDKVWANFAPKSNFVSLEYDNAKGSISGYTEETTFGDYLNLTAVPNENYAFSGWDLSKEVHFIVSKNQSTVDPAFSRLYINQKESPELSLIRGFTYYFDCNLSEGDEFFLSTTPTSGTESSYLTGVTGHLSSNGILTFQVPEDAPSVLYYHSTADEFSGNKILISSIPDTSLLSSKQNPTFDQRITHNFGLKANFERTRHSVSVQALGEGDISYTSQDIYFWGDTIEISATPKEHWYFSHWEANTQIEDISSPSTQFTINQDSEIRAIFNKVQYQVDVNATPASFGTTTQPSHTYSYGDSVTLTASPGIGKKFNEWTEIENLSFNDPEDRFNETATFTVLGEAKVSAFFSKIPIQLGTEIISLDQDNNVIIGDIGGSINLPSTIFHGDSVNLELNLSEGYSLLNWVDLDTGLPISSQNNLSFSATHDRNIQVLLRKLHYQLELSQTTGGSSVIQTSSPFYWRDQVEISANPDQHWEFDRWTGIGSENLDDPYSPKTKLHIVKDSSLKAEFKKKGYVLTVHANPSGFGGFSSIENFYNHGDLVSIQATPKGGKVFDGWKIDTNASFSEDSNPKSNPLYFTISGNAELTANFSSKQYSATYQVVVVDELGEKLEGIYGGRILGGKKFYDEDIAEFAISVSDGFKFKHWQIEKGEPVIKSTDKIYRHFMLDDLNLTAVVAERKYEVDVSLTPASGGFATLNDYFISDRLTKNQFSYGEDVNITATPEQGFRFVKWSVTGTNLSLPAESNQSFSVGNDIKLTAYFAPTGKVNLTLKTNPSNAASYIYGAGSYDYNPEHAILTLPKTGYLFSHWEYNGSIAEGVVRDAYSSTTSVSLDGDKILTAVFKVDPDSENSGGNSDEKFLLSVYSKNTSLGTTSGSGFFRGIRTIKAFPKSGYEFSHWEGGTVLDAYAPITEISVYSNISVVAHFQSVGVFDDSEVLENGWWGNPWFGYFWKVGEDDWLFHEKLGWIFLKKKGDSSIWVWIQKMDGWFWTAKEHYPYIHSSSSQTWYWINLDNSDFAKLVIYDYASSKWLSLE